MTEMLHMVNLSVWSWKLTTLKKKDTEMDQSAWFWVLKTDVENQLGLCKPREKVWRKMNFERGHLLEKKGQLFMDIFPAGHQITQSELLKERRKTSEGERNGDPVRSNVLQDGADSATQAALLCS